VRFIETIVPALSSDDDVPADRYYFGIGVGMSPEWIATMVNIVTQNWDATEKRPYAIVRNGTADSYAYSSQAVAWPTGVHGAATPHAPKNGEVTKCILAFTAQFPDNVDYATEGIGLISRTAVAIKFDTSSDHFIQVLRNAGNWELGTCDGSTISQSSAAGADGGWHDFRVEWEQSEVGLYVDGDLVITKATNLPDRALFFLVSTDNTNDLNLVDVELEWA